MEAISTALIGYGVPGVVALVGMTAIGYLYKTNQALHATHVAILEKVLTAQNEIGAAVKELHEATTQLVSVSSFCKFKSGQP